MDDKQTVERDPLPEYFNSLEELGEFWDTHSSADYEDYMEPVEFEVNLSSMRKNLRVSKDLYRALHKRAREQGVSTETLANLWLQEKLSQAVAPTTPIVPIAEEEPQPAGSPA